MEIVLKRSQTSLEEIQNLMSKFFDVRRITPGKHEWLGGDLRTEDGIGKQEPGEDAGISITIPYDEKSRRTLVTRILSPFSGTLYRIRLDNIDLNTTLAVVKTLQELGDVGFSTQSSYNGMTGPSAGVSSEVFEWPEGREAQLQKAAELYQSYAEIQESIGAGRESDPEVPPYKICRGTPSGELCPRCKYDTLRNGAEYCAKYHKPIV